MRGLIDYFDNQMKQQKLIHLSLVLWPWLDYIAIQSQREQARLNPDLMSNQLKYRHYYRLKVLIPHLSYRYRQILVQWGRRLLYRNLGYEYLRHQKRKVMANAISYQTQIASN